jgi:hypothetical protein
MIEVKLYVSALKGIDISHDLNRLGYKQGVHYDFRYIQTKWDPMSCHLVEEKHVVFMFHTDHETLASWFRLKWC